MGLAGMDGIKEFRRNGRPDPEVDPDIDSEIEIAPMTLSNVITQDV
jgi:hypothetical protein